MVPPWPGVRVAVLLVLAVVLYGGAVSMLRRES
jgi:hypothetical protein